MSRPVLLLVLAVVLAGVAAFTSRELRAPQVRTIEVGASEMAFQMSGASDAVNPALTLVAGERIRLILRNRDPGMLHDLTIERFAVRTPAIPSRESASVVFTVPQGPASASYVCSFHTHLMRGDVRVPR